MSTRLTAGLVSLLVLVACASSPSSDAVAPAQSASSPVAQAAPAPDAAGPAASNVTVPVPPPPRPSTGDEVVVGGVQNQQVRPPRGDPRTNAERMADIHAWDDCVMHAQGQTQSDPMRPQLDTPEDVCRQRLGMSSRTGVPDSRRP